MFSVCLMYFDAVLMIVCCICMMFCDSRISLRVHGGLDDVVPCLVSFCEVVSGLIMSLAFVAVVFLPCSFPNTLRILDANPRTSSFLSGKRQFAIR